MMIMEMIDGVPTPTASAHSFGRYAVSSHLGCEPQDCGVAVYQGSPVWCRDSEADAIIAYYPGKEQRELTLEERYTIAIDYLTTISGTDGGKVLAVEALRHLKEIR